MKELYEWLKLNDIPNWITLLFSLIVWPIVLFLWNKRIFKNIANLEVSITIDQMTMGATSSDCINFKFLNNTGSIVYIANARIANCSKEFCVHPNASRDIAESSYELKFFNNGTSSFTEKQIILQTNEENYTSLGIKKSLSEDFFTYKPSWIRKLFRWRKYFTLEYIAMVGKKRFKVKTIY